MKPGRSALRPLVPLIAVLPLGCGHVQARKDESLREAVHEASLDKVQKAIRAGANPNAPIDGGRTSPFLIAIADRSAEPGARKGIIEALLRAGADPSWRQKDGMDALYVAANASDAELCARFCKAGLSPVRPAFRGYSALHIAASRGATECIAAMAPFVPKDQIDAVSASRPYSDSALGLACSFGHLEAAKALLDSGADPNFRPDPGTSPLVTATVSHQIAAAELLLSRGAKVDLPMRNGATALAFASLNGDLDLMRLLIAHGADLDHPNKQGFTAMMDAAEKGHHDAVELLLKAGARADLRSKEGLTAADYEKARPSGLFGPARGAASE